MGLLNFLSRKKNSSNINKNESSKIDQDKDVCEKKENKNSNEKQEDSFLLGVDGTYNLTNSDDLVITGKVKGKISVGDAVYCSNPGDDDGDVFLSVVRGIEVGPNKPAESASDCNVGIKLENARNAKIKIGTVLHTRDKLISEVHGEYINVLGDTYVSSKNLVMTDEEIESCSITDLAEMWRLFSWFHSEVKKDESEQIRVENRKKIDRIAAVICKKLLSADEVYCVYNKATGEPNMFSRTIKQDEGYMCTPPDILIFTKAYKNVMTDYYEKNGFEIKKIENGEKGDGIYNFLGSIFYLNGACGVAVVSLNTSIDASMLVEKPDYSKIKNPAEIPVTNPDIERWLLLLGQMDEPQTDDEKLIYRLYYGFLSKEMVKGTFLIPMKKDNDIPEPDENGNTVLKKDTTIGFPTRKGKYGRDAVCMYTDWKRLRMNHDEKWSGLMQPISGIIDVLDCEINPTKFIKAGCYIGKEMYEDMKRLSEK